MYELKLNSTKNCYQRTINVVCDSITAIADVFSPNFELIKHSNKQG